MLSIQSKITRPSVLAAELQLRSMHFSRSGSDWMKGRRDAATIIPLPSGKARIVFSRSV